jgi:hypothetical protein
MENKYSSNQEKISYPSEFVDKSVKITPHYCYIYAKAFDIDWRSSNLTLCSNYVSEMEENERIMQGKEDMNKYLPLLNDSISHDDKTIMFRNLNLKPLNRGKRFMRAITGRLSKKVYDVRIDPLNPEAYEEEKDYKAKVKTYHAIGKDVEAMGMNPEQIVGEPKDQIPKDDIELEFKLQTEKRNKYAMAMEMGMNAILGSNKFDYLNNELNEDVFNHGMKAVHVYTEPSGMPKIKKIDLKKLAIGYSNRKDFTDVPRIGYYDLMTIGELRQVAKDIKSANGDFEMNNNIWEVIAKKFENKYGSNTSIPNSQYSQNNLYQKSLDFNRVPVFTCYWYSTDKNYLQLKKNNKGNKSIHPKNYGYGDAFTEEDVRSRKEKGSEREVEVITNIYKCSWICDTDIVFNYGLCSDIPRGANVWERPPLPIHVVAPDIKNGMVLSQMGLIKTDLEACTLMDIKLQYELATLAPSGFALNIDALEDVSIGNGASAMTPQDLMNLFLQKRIIVYRGKNLANQPNSGIPIKEVAESMTGHIMVYRNEIKERLDDIQQKLGENPASDASPMSPETSNGVASIMQENNNNALDYLYSADKLFHENIYKHVFLLLQEFVRRNGKEVIAKALGSEVADLIKDQNIPSLWYWGLELELRPSAEEWDMIYQQVDGMVKQGLLDPIEVFKIRDYKNIKQCIYYLTKKLEQKKKEAQQQQQQSIQANAQVQQQSLQMSQQFEMQKMQMELQAEMAKVKAEMETKIQQKEADFNIEQMKVTQQGIIEMQKQLEITKRELEKVQMQVAVQEKNNSKNSSN